MKKFISKYLIGFLFIFSCSDDFTNIPAAGALSDESLKNAQGVDLLLTGAYSLLDGNTATLTGNEFSYSGDNWWFDVIADDAHKGSTDGDQADLYQIETLNWNSANPYFLGRWEGLFAGVNRANAVIALISQVEEGDFTIQLAEARFLRGYFNFELQKMYGNVPFISEENYSDTEFNQPNSGPIWEEIEADFEFAANNLPEVQTEIGHAFSWSAKAFLGKTYLYQEKWELALTTLDDVIINGPFDLNDEYLDNFNFTGENSVESVFAIQFATDGGLSFNANTGSALNFPGGGPFNCCGFYQPTQDLANAFKTDTNGLPLIESYNESDIANDFGIESDEPFTPETGNLDPRLDYTIGRRGIDYNGYGVMPGKNWIRSSTSDIAGPYLPKKNIYQAEEGENQGSGGWGQQHSGVNFNVIRFADVLLMAAEAAVETNDLPKALNYVNRVRNRAKNMTYVKTADGSSDAANYVIEPYADFPNQSFARDAVRFERRLELGMEGQRWFDLVRWGTVWEVMAEYIQNETRVIPSFDAKVGTYRDHYDILPIPLTAIDLSGGALEQNPGY